MLEEQNLVPRPPPALHRSVNSFLPIQMSLENGFIELFCKTKKTDPKDGLNISITSSSSNTIDNEVNKVVQEDEKIESSIVEETKKKKNRLTIKQYKEKNSSINDIMNKIKDEIINSKDIIKEVLYIKKEHK